MGIHAQGVVNGGLHTPFFYSQSTFRSFKPSTVYSTMDLLRESTLGQIIRFVTKKSYFKYPEEQDEIQIPYGQTAEKVPHRLSDQPEDTRIDNADVILVDWYNKGWNPPSASVRSLTHLRPDDPANPQNWSTGKKSLVQMQLMYDTFALAKLRR